MVRRIRPHLLLLLALGLICLSACGGRQTTAEKEIAARQQVIEVVTDQQRRQALLAQIDRWDALLTESARSDAGFIARRDALNANYAATVADFQALQQLHAAEIEKLSSTFVSIRLAIIAITTEDEWNALRAARDELRQATATPAAGAKP